VIRINLLGSERKSAKKAFAFDPTRQITVICGGVLIVALGIGLWRLWLVHTDSVRLDDEIAAAQKETTRLHSVIVQVQQFEQRKAQLQQRVVLIEQLRKGQTGPVHMLDQISRALPQMLWLTELKQNDTEVIVNGKCTTLTGLSEFVSNLEASGYFKRSIEIVDTKTEMAGTPPSELIKFTIKAIFQQPGEASQPAVAAKAGG